MEFWGCSNNIRLSMDMLNIIRRQVLLASLFPSNTKEYPMLPSGKSTDRWWVPALLSRIGRQHLKFWSTIPARLRQTRCAETVAAQAKDVYGRLLRLSYALQTEPRKHNLEIVLQPEDFKETKIETKILEHSRNQIHRRSPCPTMALWSQPASKQIHGCFFSSYRFGPACRRAVLTLPAPLKNSAKSYTWMKQPKILLERT